jgi:lipopolysaccharide export system permease protein
MAQPVATPFCCCKGRAMKTINRLIHMEMITAVAFVAAGFLALFSFFDLVDELPEVGKGNPSDPYKTKHALLYVALRMPNHVYELLPIAVLIGTIFVMARLAQSSEFTILRTSGLGPWRALRTLLALGLVFTALTFALGDYVSPVAERSAQLLKSRYTGQITVGQTGAWLKEKQTYSHYAVNVGALDADASMRNIRIFEFDTQGALLSTMQAERGRFGKDDSWTLGNAVRTDFATTAQTVVAKIEHRVLGPEFRWPTALSAEMVSVAVLKPDRMRTVDLFQYITHLQANGQSAQRYELEFWRKVFYPLSCLVMVVLALPFAYLHFRSGAITGYVFGGVMMGISFFLLNNVFGFLGNLQNWQPWLAAAIPGLLYSAVSLAAFGWLVLRR